METKIVLTFILSASLFFMETQSAAQNFLSLYHSTDDILGSFTMLSTLYPERIKYDKSGPFSTVTYGDSKFGETRKRAKALFVFGEHSRELITSEVAYWLGHALCGGSVEAD